MKKIFFTIISLIILMSAYTQPLQTIRGRVIDMDSKIPLPGVNIILLKSDPMVGTVSDIDGVFRLDKVAVGRQGISVSCIGYKPVMFTDLILNSVKEVVLEVELEQNVYQGVEVVVTAEGKKAETINQMAVVSARAFTVEETEKYAGSRGDVARMAMNFAGVSSANDQRNDIVIRGNSPKGLLWRLEDVDIPNPNHFAEGGTTGGPVSMLNNNLLSNSDFFTGAFPAEYGNAMSGVFDLNMRNGNNEKHEFLFQVGFNGFEAGAEGPFNKKHKSSYLVNARYSTLDLVNEFIDLGTTGVPQYKDVTFKLNFPVKHGKISVFGIAGDSEISILDSRSDDEQDLYSGEGMDLYSRSKMAAGGVTYVHFLNDKTYFKLMLSSVYQEGGSVIDTLNELGTAHDYLDHNFTDYRASIGAFVHKKYNTHLSVRTGFSIDRMGFDLLTQFYNKDDQAFRAVIDYGKDLQHGVNLYRPYIQATYHFNDQLSVVPGLHFLHYDLNNASSLEPRIAANWQLSANKSLSLGYGRHSVTQNLSTYFLGTRLDDGTLVETNNQLGLTKSDQFVLGYNHTLTENTRLKMEAYYQNIFDVPVEQQISSFSMLNTGATWGVEAVDSLWNGGTGKNYGLEFTLERFFSKSIYYLATVSLFESKYTGSDNIERNTAFNGNYVLNVLVGKEFKLNKVSSINIDLKATFAGGKRYTPVDIAASEAAHQTKYDNTSAFSEQFDPFFKADFKIAYRIDMKRISQEWVFYVENFTGHNNVLMQTYSPSKNEVSNVNQLGVFPMMQYRLHF
ncbi:MAG: TonB-dependent receptor [Bacteroidales bacterium]|nr:TonB-dependent receptor [Bacteroidales bacterium]